MRFKFEGTEFLIEFERQSKTPSVVARPRIYTTARLLKQEGDKRTTVREGTVGHYFRDRFSFESGRKFALAKALYDAPTMNGKAPLIGTPLSKTFRTEVWKAYHGRTTESAGRAGHPKA